MPVKDIALSAPIAEPMSAPLVQFDDLLGALEADAARRRKANIDKTPLGPVTGLAELDILFGRALEPGLHIMHGGPGVGKTALALQIASSCQCPALYVSCEMSPLELLRRHTARVTGTFLGRLKDGSLSAAEIVSKARQSAVAAPFMAVLDATEVFAPPARVKEAAEKIRRRHNAEHLLVVVDSLHSWSESMTTGDVTEYECLNAALMGLRIMAKQLNCTVLAISERNRAGMKSDGLSSGAGTRKIEYGSESVFSLDAEGEPDHAGDTLVRLKFAKNRNGQPGAVLNLTFNGARQEYRVEAF